METEIVNLNPDSPEEEKILPAVNLIKKGEIIGFPTETVYGLAADAFNERAVDKLFEIKRRPKDIPLTIQIASIDKLSDVIIMKTEIVETLARDMWPGPLTLILEKKEIIPNIVTSGKKTVGIRIPANRIALKLLELLKTPIVAPSANFYLKHSPTSAKQVRDNFNNIIPMILDGGESKIGIASTIVDLTTDPPRILREGSITKD
ncbi:unnamed protein product, partial [marine sediment metagenome]